MTATKPPPLCRYCGKPIGKRTRLVWIVARPLNEQEKNHNANSHFSRYLSVAKLPTTKAECQSTTNHQVVSVKYGAFLNADYDDTAIGRFTEWDRESYVDKFFCNGDHAKSFGYLFAKEGKCTVAFTQALGKQREKANAA